MRRTTRVSMAFVIAAITVLAARPYAQDDARGARDSQATSRPTRYIVQMSELPVATYSGGVAGLAPTKKERGQKIDPADPQVAAYGAYLSGRHDQVLSNVGGGRKLYDYSVVFNGFAAELTDDQAEALRALAGVVTVTKDTEVFADTSSTPAFLGLDGPTGLWNQLGGTARAGDGVIVGVIDSGIWPESESFSDRTGTNGNGSKGGKLDYHHMPDWHGKCQNGEAFNGSDCNQKLIGARYYNAGQGGNAGIDPDKPWEFNSARDYNGHGTHTSSTAAGNAGVQTSGPAKVFGSINGMAPHARLAVYKALWSTKDGAEASGTTSDIVAAIDQAVADGVDVINYSISGTSTNFLDPAEIAFLNAADAGFLWGGWAGNSGPTTATVAHPSPWLTTVAAGTHNRDGKGSVTLGNGATYNGASLATPVGPAALIDSATA